ncbi:MAG TPA: NAD-dependent epimerase/dehydratase family protein [Thermoanaerobaculia bacterium]|nr:NAD-dependent epimerase/dehydratase family protein [Thermoanaerobaculia bacterium]
MKVLVTGGTGFLGRRVVAELVSRPEVSEVRVLVRGSSSRDRFPQSVAFAPGDVTDLPSLVRACQGCDTLLHAAALVKILAPARDFDRINVEGLKNALAAAESAGLSRCLYVSSFMALGPTEDGPGGLLDESAEPRERPWINDYERTKTLADRIARQAIAAGAPVSVVYPGVIYGPGELTEGNIVVRHILDLVHRKLPALLGKPERRWNYVHVEDVARGILAVLDHPPGSRYVLGGENVTQGDFYKTVEELTAVRMPRMRMPDGLAKLAGAAQKSWARLRGTTPQLTPDLVEVYRHDWSYSSDRAKAELGYRFRSLQEGLQGTIAWLHEIGRWQPPSPAPPAGTR